MYTSRTEIRFQGAILLLFVVNTYTSCHEISLNTLRLFAMAKPYLEWFEIRSAAN